MNMSFEINVDIGGTFTDTFIIKDGCIATGKAETTSYDLSVGFLNSVEVASRGIGLSLQEALKKASLIRYSSTIGTNALIERSGPKLGLITTRGFEETIHIGRARNWADGLPREQVLDKSRAQRPKPLIPRELIVGVKERIDCFGKVVMPLREEEALEKIQYLVDQGVRGFVICLLWSFLNPIHELKIKEIITREYPDTYLGRMPILLSSDVSPRMGEYQRSITTILDAYLRTEAEEHFMTLNDELRDRGCQAPLLIAHNTGGLSSISRTRAINLYGSGPVAGTMGGAYIGRLYQAENVIVTDMGGTSFDLGMILEGKERVYEFEPILDRWRINLSIIATHSIGAGGGSIARVDDVGRLRVGPESAGAMPGPACYNKGGREPTVTDADVVLGYIDPDYFLGGRQKLSKDRAIRAIERKIADPLNIGVEEAAFRIRKLVDGTMGQEIYKRTALEGYDPREFLLFAFGGAGPVHCCEYAEYADIAKIRTFPFGSVFNAFGTSTMDVIQTYEKSRRFVFFDPLTQSYATDYDGFNEVVRMLQLLALRDMDEEGFKEEEITFQLELNAVYARQIHSTRFTSPRLVIKNESDVRAICEAFNQAYAEVYSKGAIYPEGGIEVTDFKLNATASLLKPKFPTFELKEANPKAALKGTRAIFWEDEGRFAETAVYQHSLLQCGNIIPGPALIEAEDTVYVIPKRWEFTVDKYLNGVIAKV